MDNKINTIFYFIDSLSFADYRAMWQNGDIAPYTIVFASGDKAIYKDGVQYGKISDVDLLESLETLIKLNPNDILPTATSTTLGAIKIGFDESNADVDHKYAVRLDGITNRAYVTIPWNALKEYDSANYSGLGKKTLKVDKNGNNILTYQDFQESNTIYVITNDFDLNDQSITIPQGCILLFDGGSLSNGTLVGTNTQIDAPNYSIFTGITIEGTWNVPYITSTWFSDATQNNKLKNVFALLNADIYNKIVIEKGIYYVSVENDEDAAISLKSNLDLVINGTITMWPNALTAYYIFHIYNEKNITISGSGMIVGDKTTHTGTSGLWGHCIMLLGSFITIKDITIKDSWGDCICIGKKTSLNIDIDNIIIDNCYLDNGRRQGISITHGNNIVIRNCHITNVEGHDPRAAIDIEPNEDNYARNITIDNCRIENCIVGIVIYKRGYYDKSCITISNCYVKCRRRAISVNGISTAITVTNCELYTRFHTIDANTVDGSLDNVILFSNNIIHQIPEPGDDLSADSRLCAIYAIKGNYKFSHNDIVSWMPVFRFASGGKYIEDNDITCPTLFFESDVDDVVIKGNIIKGNVRIPGSDTIIEGNRITGNLIDTKWIRFDLAPIPSNDEERNTLNPSDNDHKWMVKNGGIYSFTDHTSIHDDTTYYVKIEGGSDSRSRIINNEILCPSYNIVSITEPTDSRNPNDRGWYEKYQGDYEKMYKFEGYGGSPNNNGDYPYYRKVQTDNDFYVLTQDTSIVEGKNYYTINSSGGSSTFNSRGDLIIDNNRLRNIKFKINGDGGRFNNNEISYNSNFILKGILIDNGLGKFSSNNLTYSGVLQEEGSVYIIRSKTIDNNRININSDVRTIFYPANDPLSDVDAYVIGNLISIADGVTVTLIAGSSANKFIQPVYRNTGTTEQRPIFAVDEYYYIGCKYFDTDLNRFITWNGSKWIDTDGAPLDVVRKGTSANRPSAADIYTNFSYFDTTLDKYIFWNNSQWVDATGAPITVRIQYYLTNVSASNKKQPEAGALFTTVLTADEGYSLPATIRIDMDSNTLTAGTDYTYNQSTGEVVVLGVGGTGGVTGRKLQIVATGVELNAQ